MGTLAIPCLAPCFLKPSPDGQRLLAGGFVDHEEPAPVSDVFDASGSRIGSVGGGPSSVWADDSRHVCTLRALNPTVAPAPPPSSSLLSVELELATPGAGTPRPVAEVGAGITADIGSWNVLACSVTANRAVLEIGGEVERAVRVVELSTGRILYSRDDQTQPGTCACPVGALLVSHDATIAIENMSLGGLRFRDLSTGATTPGLAGLSGQAQVLGLSWNGRRALTSAGLFDVASGRMLWRASSKAVGLYTERPGSDDVLVVVAAGSSDRLAIVRGDGSELDLPARYG